MSPCGSSLEEQLSSVMDVLSKAAMSEMYQLFSEGSPTIRLQITQSLKENEALRTRMKAMRSELFSLRLPTRSNAVSIVNENSVDSGDLSTPRGATTESPRADAAVSSHMSDHELRILCVYGRGEGPLAADGHDTLFNASELEALSSLSPDHGITQDSLLSSNSGPSERVPAQDSRGGPGREGQAERHQRLQAAALSLKHAAPEAEDPGRGPGPFGAQSHLQHSLEFPQGGAQRLDCDERLFISKELIGHRDGPNGATPIPRAFCGKSLASKAKLGMDMRIHTGEKPYGCVQCGKRFTLRCNLKMHLRIHTGEKPYGPCVQCGKRFTQSSSLKIHLRTHSGEKPYGCQHCNAHFSDPRLLHRHMMRHAKNGLDPGDRSTPHGATTERLRADAAVSSNMSAPDEELRILSVYGRGEGPLAAEGHDALFTASELEALSSLSPDHSITHDNLLSSNSGPSERVPAQRMQHGRGAPGRDGQADRYGCVQCGKRFTQSGSLKIHLRIHTGEKPYGCVQCGKRFRSGDKLKVHLRTHSGQKPYGCVQCGKRFRQGDKLKVHLRTHSGEKPCVCQHCNARFSDPSNLRQHMMRHADSTAKTGVDSEDRSTPHGATMESSCAQRLDCDERLFISKELFGHLDGPNGATPVPRAFCGKSLASKAKLGMDMRIHTGEKPYGCVQCGKRFRQVDKLKIHLRTHSGEKPCVCQHCNAGFSDPSNLRRHMLKHAD